MRPELSHFVIGLLAPLTLMSDDPSPADGEPWRREAMTSYMSRMLPLEREIFLLLEREWQTAAQLDELARAERFRSAMLAYLDRGIEDEQVRALTPVHLVSLFQTRRGFATRELQSAFARAIDEAESSGDEALAARLAEERAELETAAPTVGLPDAAPDKYRVRLADALDGERWSDVVSDESPPLARDLGRVALGGDFLPGDAECRRARILMLSGESCRGYLTAEFSALDAPPRYFFGVYDGSRTVAEISLPLTAGELYSWRIRVEPDAGTARFELHDERSRQQRLFLPWKDQYELGFGASLDSPERPARLMLILFPETSR
jgi:hypothetical protein